MGWSFVSRYCVWTALTSHAVFAAIFMSTSAHSGEVANNIRQLCHQRWPDDYAMEEFCQKKQRDDLLALSALVEQFDGPRNFITQIANRCRREWTEGSGLIDYSMVNFCTKKQIGAAQRLGEVPQSGSDASGSADSSVASGTPVEEPQVAVHGNTVDTFTGEAGAAFEKQELEKESTGGPKVLVQPSSSGENNERRMTVADLMANWRAHIGRKVVVVDAYISQASKESMLISGEGGQFWARQPRRKNDVAYLVRNCAEKSISNRCLIPVIGVVRQYGTELVMLFPEFDIPE